MANPVQPSASTQQLLAAAGVAAAADAAAAAQVSSDQQSIQQLNAQLAQAQTTTAADQTTAQQADAMNNAAYIAACQSLAADFAVPLPQTIPTPPATPAK